MDGMNAPPRSTSSMSASSSSFHPFSSSRDFAAAAAPPFIPSGGRISILTTTASTGSVAPPPPPPPPPVPPPLATEQPRTPPSSSSSSSSLLSSSSSTLSLLPVSTPTFSDPSTSAATHGTQQTGVLAINDGVVVVGAIGRVDENVSQLLNRLIDARVFGCCHSRFSGLKGDGEKSASDNAGVDLKTSSGEGERQEHLKGQRSEESLKREEWLKNRLWHYYDREKGVVYVLYTWGTLPPTNLSQEEDTTAGLSLFLESTEATSMRGLLYMFSVCHVVLLVQEGARFDTSLLRTLRILQNAKHMLAPFVRFSGLFPNSPASKSLSEKPGGRGGLIMSVKSGSAPSLFPGQCTPVLLFVFLEDFSDISSSSSSLQQEEGLGSPLSTSGTQSLALPSASRHTLYTKGQHPVVMLARSANKAEGGYLKKLQASLDAQIRFLIKRCRVLSGLGDAGPSLMAPRGPGSGGGPISGMAGGGALFVLDTARSVFLVDRGGHRAAEALTSATGIIEDILKGKDVSRSALTHLVATRADDIQAIRDFIWRQAETLRGRGGALSSNASGGSAGVGMVAAAAAAAAASAAGVTSGGSSGNVKAFGTPPELPSFEIWSSACNVLIEMLAASDGQSFDEIDRMGDAKTIKIIRNTFSSAGSRDLPSIASQVRDSLPLVVSCLECKMGLDMKFSVAWCKRLLPTAHDIYLKGLPPCYPTSVHSFHLEKALRAFRTMVRGPAVLAYCEKLKEECDAAWRSGRQLCEAISLTGRHCTHQVHEVVSVPEGSNLPEMHRTSNGSSKTHRRKTELKGRGLAKPHSSGVVFLHACACGRSRRLRPDPFDYENANVTFFHFPNCENLLPSLVVPSSMYSDPLGPQSWSIIRLGSDKYYEASIGLVQSGFSKGHNLLSSWVVPRSDNANLEDSVTIYVGFEHECPRGHRFFLSLKHLTDLGYLSSRDRESVLKITERGPESTKQQGKMSSKAFQSADRIPFPGHVKGSASEASIQNSVQNNKVPSQPQKMVHEDTSNSQALTNMNLPIYMKCPFCSKVPEKNRRDGVNFASTISQLQRIFVVTAALPVLLSASPVVQFENPLLSSGSLKDTENCLEFSLGCSVILPPESFLSIRLPFVYCTKPQNGNGQQALLCNTNQPEATGWLRGTALKVISCGMNQTL